MSDGDEDIPKDAKIVKTLLKSMGIEDYEPIVVRQFLELWYRYVVDVLTDAQVYSEHAGKSVIDCDDVKLAIQSKVNSSFSQPPPREVMLELARKRNRIPLPKLVSPGIPLPNDHDTLINPNYQLGIMENFMGQQNLRELMEEEDDDDDDEKIDDAVDVMDHNPNPNQEHRDTSTPQRVSFSIGDKRQR
ncbi:transcription initiation factor TFIID subunit 9-like [Impatiens glandulifera]|uniref:transcription initiation factor TFIID subunit 9-like n=1 Tax=Impatiens glandulifera TaxID=253017 RepID=UPI001FB13FD1|nr:transcription initiation factor TFIID subunit 9-like [Impatiens glandulifera]